MSGEGLWQAVTTSAMLGTQRRPVEIPPESGALGELLLVMQKANAQNGGSQPEDLLLGALSAAAVHRRAGWLPQSGVPMRFDPCPPDDRPRCTQSAGMYLETMLAGQYREMLPEWIELAAATRQRIPEEFVEALFAHKKLLQPCRPAFAQALGERGRWLALQISRLRGKPPPLGFGLRWDETIWHEGKGAQRAEYLADLRLHDPQRALELLSESWPKEAPTVKVHLIKALEENLSARDEPFLEAALADRSQEVRSAAAALLARLPNSQYAARMAALVGTFVTWKTGLLRSTLVVHLPPEDDAELLRAGVDPLPLPDSRVGKRAGLLVRALQLVPPGFWCAAWNRRPAQILEAVRKNEWEHTLLWGWETAAARTGDAGWLEALIAYRTRSGDYQGAVPLLSALPAEAQDRLVIGLLRENKSLSWDEPPSIFLSACRHPWGLELTRAVINAIRLTLHKSDLEPWRWEKLMRDIPPYFHPDLLESAELELEREIAQIGQSAYFEASRRIVKALIEALRFRRFMRSSLLQPMHPTVNREISPAITKQES